jgi:uncharacterized protein (DUF362 family)
MISQKHNENNDWDYVITHGSVVRAVIDYIFLALEGNGRVIIGDSPQTDSKFSEIVALMGLRQIQTWYRKFHKFEIEIINLQDEYWIEKNGVYTDTVRLVGDPRGGISTDLGKDSLFTELDGMGKKFYGAFYNVQETNDHHSKGKHEYAVSRSPLVADVFINVPKLKTHKKCGLTTNLKSLVGINANKNWLPHYSFGSPETGGDQFEKATTKGKLENIVVVKAKRILLKRNPLAQFVARRVKNVGYKIFGRTDQVIRSGNWHGNDTTWRMALDLNKILLYANADGTMRRIGHPKRYYSVVDGIISMEGNGPAAGVSKNTGLIIAGNNPVSVDSVCCKLMGFSWKKIPLIYNAFKKDRYPLANCEYNDISVVSNISKFNKRLKDLSTLDSLKFIPPLGWKGHIEE